MNQISVSELKQRLQDGSVNLLDVRQPDEREEFHIPDTFFIPIAELEDRIDELENVKDKELIVYCRSGNRSGTACMFLELSGFTNVVNLVGGTLAYRA